MDSEVSQWSQRVFNFTTEHTEGTEKIRLNFLPQIAQKMEIAFLRYPASPEAGFDFTFTAMGAEVSQRVAKVL